MTSIHHCGTINRYHNIVLITNSIYYFLNRQLNHYYMWHTNRCNSGIFSWLNIPNQNFKKFLALKTSYLITPHNYTVTGVIFLNPCTIYTQYNQSGNTSLIQTDRCIRLRKASPLEPGLRLNQLMPGHTYDKYFTNMIIIYIV